MNQSTALTIVESQRLAAFEKIVEEGMGTFVNVGSALLAIRDEKLYRQDYLTFGQYVHKRWGITRGRAYQLIAAGLMSTQVDIQNERQSRILQKLDSPEERQLAWAIARDISDHIAPGKIVPLVAVRAAVEVVGEAKTTGGYVDPGTGEMETLAARVTQEVYETTRRQQQHVRESIERKEGNDGKPRFTGRFTVVAVNVKHQVLALIVQPDLLAAVGQGEKGTYQMYLDSVEAQPPDATQP